MLQFLIEEYKMKRDFLMFNEIENSESQTKISGIKSAVFQKSNIKIPNYYFSPFGVIVLILICVCGPAVLPSLSAQTIQKNKYVTTKNGHFYYNGERLRFWGINFATRIRRKGKALELLFDRLQDVGFNAVRINLMDQTFLGQGSRETGFSIGGEALDRLDKAIYLARQRNMFFWISFDRPLQRRPYQQTDYDLLPDQGDRAQWLKAVRSVPSQTGMKILPYIDERVERAHQEYARQILEHVNPYTGKRYADDETIALFEISNENRFLTQLLRGGLWSKLPRYLQDKVKARWNQWLREKYGNDQAIIAAWGKLGKAEGLSTHSIEFQPVLDKATRVNMAGDIWTYRTGTNGAGYSKQRHEDIVRFVFDLYKTHTARFIRFVRSLGKPGKGISVIPFTVSGGAGPQFPMYYTLSFGDYISLGNYGFATRRDMVSKDEPNYPFFSRLNAHPCMEVHGDVVRMKNKPYVYYEVGDYRPNPFRVEYPVRVALNAIWNDGDGVFWFNWDNQHDLGPLNTDKDYTTSRLAYSRKNHANAALILATDEVMLAAIKSAGALFRSGGLPPAPDPATIVIGKELLFDLSGKTFSQNITRLRHHQWRRGLRLIYDSNAPTRIPLPMPTLSQRREKYLCMGKYVTFDWRDNRGFVQVDAPSAKLYVGFTKPSLRFKNTTIDKINRDFLNISIIAEDALPLEKSASILVTASAQARNTGFKFDVSRMTKKWRHGLLQAVVHRGAAPIKVDRVAMELRAPWLKHRHFKKVDFSRKVYAEGTCRGSFSIRADEPFFYAILTPFPDSAR
jgi:hypothetical protein